MSGKFMMNGIEYLGGSSGGGGGNVDDVYVNGESVLDGNKIAQVTSYKEVTLAEYMALPDTKLTDGIMYCIKDVGGSNQFPPLIYSDEEREVGVWIDGKPLYQKSFVITNIPSSFSDYIECQIINDMESAVKIEFVAKRLVSGNPTYYVGNGVSIGETAATYLIGFRQRDNKIYYIVNQYGSNISDIQVTVQYTKTTDTPGSGTWTTQGSYSHHYSTTEHVIGTWIDGKPLYEKTVSCGALPNNTTKYVPHGVQNANFINIVNAFASYTDGSYHTQIPLVSLYNVANGAVIAIVGDNILLQARTDLSGYNICYITLQYTKTTD